jgi:DNA-directed RNA polymerase I, II, and III subunit RPABC3
MHGKLYRISYYTPPPPPPSKKDEDTSTKNDEDTPKQDPKVYGFPFFLILN